MRGEPDRDYDREWHRVLAAGPSARCTDCSHKKSEHLAAQILWCTICECHRFRLEQPDYVPPARPSWDEYALRLAETAADRSEDPYVKVGAVVLRADHSVASVGYNGAPPGVQIDWTDRDRRRAFVIHAETNALRYVTTAEVAGGVLAVSHLPCPQCLVNTAAYGIKRVVYRFDLENYPTKETEEVAGAVGIDLILHGKTNHKEEK